MAPSPAPAQPQLPLGARSGGPGVARRWRQPSRIGFHASCWGCSAAVAAFPLNYLGLAPLPAPHPPGGSVTATKSNPQCRRGMLALPAHLRPSPAGSPAADSPAWGRGHLAKQFTGARPSGLTPSRLVGNGNRGLNTCPCPHRPPAPRPLLGEHPAACRPGAAAPRGRRPVTRHGGKAALATSASHSYRDQLLRACDRCDKRAEYLLLFLF